MELVPYVVEKMDHWVERTVLYFDQQKMLTPANKTLLTDVINKYWLSKPIHERFALLSYGLPIVVKMIQKLDESEEPFIEALDKTDIQGAIQNIMQFLPEPARNKLNMLRKSACQAHGHGNSDMAPCFLEQEMDELHDTQHAVLGWVCTVCIPYMKFLNDNMNLELPPEKFEIWKQQIEKLDKGHNLFASAVNRAIEQGWPNYTDSDLAKKTDG